MAQMKSKGTMFGRLKQIDAGVLNVGYAEAGGVRDSNCADWYAAYMAAEQAGTELPESARQS
jgi:hypothetical protein